MIMKGQRRSKARLLLIGLGVLLLVSYIGFSIWYVFELRSERTKLEANLQEVTSTLDELKQEVVTQPGDVIARLQQETTENVLDAVKKLYSVPEDENPTIATVQDIEKLRDQPFFDGAQNGDVLIVFENSSQALLYRPSENKLVKVGPISIDANTPTLPSQPAEPASGE
jgi:cell division protein FtsB